MKLPQSEAEWLILVDQVTCRPEQLVRRLSRHLRDDGECKLWTGQRHPKGYGRLTFRFRGHHYKLYAHRLFLMLISKAPIPKGFEAGHHTCHNEACVRHVRLERSKDNLRDMHERKKKKSG